VSEPDDPHALAATAARHLLDRFRIPRVDVGLVLGSGWSAAVAGAARVVGRAPLADLPGFARPVVAGHGGEALLLEPASGRRVLVLTGRTHLYEGRGVAPVVHGVRTLAAAGASRVVLTNGCGGLDPAWAPGTDLVGMSTALETIAAREAGLEVLGISLVTNAAAGLQDQPLSHAEVIQAGADAVPRLTSLLSGLLERL